MVSGHHIRLIQVSNFLDLNIYAKTPWGPRVVQIDRYKILDFNNNNVLNYIAH